VISQQAMIYGSWTTLSRSGRKLSEVVSEAVWLF
jgi:hypothetical protein